MSNRTAAAAVQTAESHPLTAAAIRRHFPRTTDRVLARIIRTVKHKFPVASDEQMAFSAIPVKGQETPALFESIIADNLSRLAKTQTEVEAMRIRDAAKERERERLMAQEILRSDPADVLPETRQWADSILERLQLGA